MKRRKTINLGQRKLEEGDPKSVTISALDGEDEILAGERAQAVSRYMEEMIAQAIVQVDGKDVVPPFVDWMKWSSRCRDFVRAAFHKMNSAQPKELEAFLAAEFGEDELGAQP